MTNKPWSHLKRALTSPGNVVAGAGALALSAITWNPLPLVLYGLGEPVLLYNAVTTKRYAAEVLEEQHQSSLAFFEDQLEVLTYETPCGRWMTGGQLPDYPRSYARLVEIRDQTARIVASRNDAARSLEDDIIVRMADMLRAYLLIVKERLLFHCALAQVYPQLPERERPPTWLDRVKRALVRTGPRVPRPWTEATPFVSLEQARKDVRAKADGFRAEIARHPEHAEVYGSIIETLDQRIADLDKRGRNDLDMRAQLKVFPDQFELILSKLGTLRADVGEVVADMQVLLEQTDDTVSFAEDLRASETATLGRLLTLDRAA